MYSIVVKSVSGVVRFRLLEHFDHFALSFVTADLVIFIVDDLGSENRCLNGIDVSDVYLFS